MVIVNDVNDILDAFRDGRAQAEGELVQAVYSELRRMAGAKMAGERAGHTLQATALVHEAWMDLGEQRFENRAHFFSAAAEAMRRILVDSARRKACAKRGAGAEHVDVDGLQIAAPDVDGNALLAVHEALDRLEKQDVRKAELVKLRYFAGLSFDESAEVLGISVVTAKRDWAFARAWLHQEIGEL